MVARMRCTLGSSKASHPDGKKMRKVQPVPILLPQAVQPDSENQTSEHHEDGGAENEMEVGMRRPEKKPAPEEPTEQERTEHSYTHIPLQVVVQALRARTRKRGALSPGPRRSRAA